MKLPPFKLERFFARHEFAVKHLLGASDIEAMSMSEVLALADTESASLWNTMRLGYTESRGHPLLRAEIASQYASLSEDAILTFAGAEEGIFLAMHALLEAGDHVVGIWPAYQSLHDVARSIGAEVTLVPLDPGDWSLDVSQIEAACRESTRVVVVNFPHSPTGALIPVGDFERLAAWCESRGIHLLSDEVYRYLEADPSARLPAAVDRGARTISVGVMSKAYGLAGLRIGWLATHDAPLLQRIASLKDYTTICNSAPSEILALIGLRAWETLTGRSRAILEENLPLLDRFFAQHRDRLSWVRPRGGTICFPRLLHGDGDAFAAALLRDAGVLVLPGSQFGYDTAYFRIGFGRTTMPSALVEFESFLERTNPG